MLFEIMESMSKVEVGSPSEDARQAKNDMLRNYLVEHTHTLAHQRMPFEARNRGMAETVADEASIQAGDLLRANPPYTRVDSTGLRQVFFEAALDAGQDYGRYFDPQTGEPVKNERTVREFDDEQRPMRDVGRFARKFLPDALRAAGITGVDVTALLEKAGDFRVALQLTAYQLGKKLDGDYSHADVRKVLNSIIAKLPKEKRPRYRDLTERITYDKDFQPLSDEELKAMDIAIRLSNAVWKVGQVHRAVWEGHDERISTKRGIFDTYDNVVKRNYDAFVGSEGNDSAIMGSALVEVWKDIKQLAKPENFRGESQDGWLPDRIVEETRRVKALRELIAQTTPDKEVARRLFDLIVYNCYGNVFPPANSATDMIGVPDAEKYGANLENCVVLVVRKRGGKLAPAGGFADMGEAPSQTGAREGGEETHAQYAECIPYAVLSDPARDERFNVVSAVFAGMVDIDPAQLYGADDVKDVVIVPLKNEDGSFNKSYFEAGTYTDATGKEFTHNGIFAGHGGTLKRLYDFLQQNGGSEGKTLREVIRERSQLYPQDWFKGAAPHPAGTDNYDRLTVDGKGELLLTPNVRFAYQQTTRIFVESGMSPDEAAALASRFVYDATAAAIPALDDPSQTEVVELLPKFPQPAVTLDCMVLTGPKKDRLLVERRANGELRLIGTFYHKEKSQGGSSIEADARQVVPNKAGVNLVNAEYVGPVGGTVATGGQADRRYPRDSHVMLGEAEGEIHLNPELVDPDSEFIELSIWTDDSHTQVSDEILHGQWGFNHNSEIILPFINALRQRAEAA